ncbi:MAG: hypothetical protein LUK37_02345 [Clostridia bacterium]|nr:hypothetical protein [Clostridia bacterium]
MGFFEFMNKMTQKDAIPPLIRKRINEVEYVRFDGAEEFPPAIYNLEVEVDKLPSRDHQDFLARLLDNYDHGEWIRNSIGKAIIKMRSGSISHSLLVRWRGGYQLAYELDTKSRSKIIALMQKYGSEASE